MYSIILTYIIKILLIVILKRILLDRKYKLSIFFMFINFKLFDFFM